MGTKVGRNYKRSCACPQANQVLCFAGKTSAPEATAGIGNLPADGPEEDHDEIQSDDGESESEDEDSTEPAQPTPAAPRSDTSDAGMSCAGVHASGGLGERRGAHALPALQPQSQRPIRWLTTQIPRKQRPKMEPRLPVSQHRGGKSRESE